MTDLTNYHRFESSNEVTLLVTTERGTALVLGTTGDPAVVAAAEGVLGIIADERGVDRLSLVIDAHHAEVREVAAVRTVAS